MKAALFAAGCLSEMSDDFATVFLEVLRTTVMSQETSKDIKLAGGRAFAKMWCSFSIAEQAYKVQHFPTSKTTKQLVQALVVLYCAVCCDVYFSFSHIKASLSQ